MAKTKVCSGCKKRKSIALFSNKSNQKDGLHYYCKSCKTTSEIAHYKAYGKEKRRATVNVFLSALYSNMKKRVEGRNSSNPHLWAGLPIMPRETFYEWSRNHPDFLKLFKRWSMSGRDRKLVPSINRINSDKGYTLDNVEWLTSSQNNALAGVAKSFNKRRAVYDLLGERKNG